MTPSELRERWEQRKTDYARTRAMVSGEAIADEVLHDIDELRQNADNESLNLQEAASWSGYSARHLGRLVREGKLDNVGRPNAPRVLRGQLPIKAGRRLTEEREASILASKVQIARSIVHPKEGDDG